MTSLHQLSHEPTSAWTSGNGVHLLGLMMHRMQGKTMGNLRRGEAVSVIDVQTHQNSLAWLPHTQLGSGAAKLRIFDPCVCGWSRPHIRGATAEVLVVHSDSPGGDSPTASPIRMLSIEAGQSMVYHLEVRLQQHDIILHPENGMLTLLIRPSSQQLDADGPGRSTSDRENRACSLTFYSYEIQQNDCAPATRTICNISTADVHCDNRVKYLGLSQAQEDGSTTISIMRTLDLQDQCSFTMAKAQYQPAMKTEWRFEWAVDSSLVAIWQVPLRNKRHLPSQAPGQHLAVELAIIRTNDGVKLHTVLLDVYSPGRPELDQEMTVAWSPDAQQLAFWGRPDQLQLNRDQLVLLDIASGFLTTWQEPASCTSYLQLLDDEQVPDFKYRLIWATSSQWLLAAIEFRIADLDRNLIEGQIDVTHAFAVDAANCNVLCELYSTNREPAAAGFMAGDFLFGSTKRHEIWDEECMPCLIHIHPDNSCNSSMVQTAGSQPARHKMQCSIYSNMAETFTVHQNGERWLGEGTGFVAMSDVFGKDNGSIPPEAACNPALDIAGKPQQPMAFRVLQTDGNLKIVQKCDKYCMTIKECHGFYTDIVMDMPGVVFLGLPNIAWRPNSPPHQQIFALHTDSMGLLLVDASNHLVLKSWTVGEMQQLASHLQVLDELGRRAQIEIKTWMRAASSVGLFPKVQWSPDGNHLAFGYCKDNNDRCMILTFC